jgi:hypothetical protein
MNEASLRARLRAPRQDFGRIRNIIVAFSSNRYFSSKYECGNLYFLLYSQKEKTDVSNMHLRINPLNPNPKSF